MIYKVNYYKGEGNMGTFVALSGIIGKTEIEALKALNSYFEKMNKELKETALNTEIYNLFILSEDKKNTVIIYPENFSEFREIAMHLTRELRVPIFNIYVYDIGLWMYEMYYNGEIIDKFIPMAKCLKDIQEIDIQSYKGNPNIVCKYLNNINIEDIKEYYKFWTDDFIKCKEKAYENDEFPYGVNWQAVDFMNKLNLKYPITDEEETIGRVFKLILRML
jgi:hypothetical protein